MSATSREAKAQQTNLLAQANLKQAQTYWAAIEAACNASNADAANGPLMIYVDYLRGLYPAGFITSKSGTKEALFLGHLNTIFPYVGYPAPNLPGGAAGPLQAGILGVIFGTGGTREYFRPHLGAFRLAEQQSGGDQRGHLFAMYPLGVQCLSVDNLRELASCTELASFPDVAPKFLPGIKVGICVPEGLTGNGLSLGHEVEAGITEVAGQLAYPSTCHGPENVGSWTGGVKDVLTRLAWIGKSSFGIRSAYATDKGLGGIGGGISPFGVLEAQIFAASFNVPPNAIGAPPVDDSIYTFTYSSTAPGSIAVQNTLGNATTGPLVVLSQGGGACANCGGLQLRANFYSVSGTPADDGVYDVNWISVQASPSVKGAPFVVRDGSGREVARLTYVTTLNQNQLLYNGTVVSSWTRNVAQSFTIRVDLNTKKTSLFINGDPYAGPVGFVNPAANSLASITADFTGIDSGVMGWDEIGVSRIADQPQPGS